MKKIENNSKELALTESRALRNGYVNNEDNFDILDKIKAIKYLHKDMVVNVEQAANYYEVSNEAIKTIIKRHRDELESDGIMVLKGQALKEFKLEVCEVQGEPSKYISNKTQSLTILTKRAMFRIGMLLTTSMVAKAFRNYLLDLEEKSREEEKERIIARQIGKIDRKRMTTAMSKYIEKQNKFMYPTYTNMIYKILFNKDAKTMKQERNISTNELLRDSFTGEELRLVDEAETIVTGLVTLGFEYSQIKQQLQNKYIKQLS